MKRFLITFGRGMVMVIVNLGVILMIAAIVNNIIAIPNAVGWNVIWLFLSTLFLLCVAIFFILCDGIIVNGFKKNSGQDTLDNKNK